MGLLACRCESNSLSVRFGWRMSVRFAIRVGRWASLVGAVPHSRAAVIRATAAQLESGTRVAPAYDRSIGMPEKATIERARRAKRSGKAPTTQAGEFVREEIHHVREGKHGARSTKQAIAIGLSKARRAGVKLPAPPRSASPRTRKAAESATRAAKRGRRKPSPGRSRDAKRALGRKGRTAVSRQALARQAKSAARRRPAAARRAAARRAVRTKGPKARREAARKAARTRQRRRTRRTPA